MRRISSSEARALVDRDPALAAELIRRAERSGVVERPYLVESHAPQRAFIDDPSKRKAALCSRRSGKSRGAAIWMLLGAEDSPGGLSVYIALTRNNARLIMWNALKQIDKQYRLGLWFREIDGQLYVQHSNSHKIWLAGCKDASEVDKFRGVGGESEAGIRRCVIDEGQAYGSYLTTLIDDALEPTLMDQDGELALIGTPGPIPDGAFYEATCGESSRWSLHSWTVLDNPYLKVDPETWLRDYRESNHWDESHPTYQREWLAKWVLDRGALVYPYEAALNAWSDELPGGDWQYGLGIDVGFNDDSAFVIAAMRHRQPEIYVVRAYKRSGLIPARMAAEVEAIKREFPIQFTAIDTGGLGKAYSEEMLLKYGIFLNPAKKQEKRAAQEILAGDLRSGLVKIDPHKAGCLVDEWMSLQWNARRDAEDARFPNHASDAFLYIHRAMRASYSPQIDPGGRVLSDEMQVAIAAARKKRGRR